MTILLTITTVYFAWFITGLEVEYIKDKEWLRRLKESSYS